MAWSWGSRGPPVGLDLAGERLKGTWRRAGWVAAPVPSAMQGLIRLRSGAEPELLLHGPGLAVCPCRGGEEMEGVWTIHGLAEAGGATQPRSWAGYRVGPQA